LPLTTQPTYFDLSDDNGEFIISNIKEGIYKFFALEDLNQN
jgi:hypothetical protein